MLSGVNGRLPKATTQLIITQVGLLLAGVILARKKYSVIVSPTKKLLYDLIVSTMYYTHFQPSAYPIPVVKGLGWEWQFKAHTRGVLFNLGRLLKANLQNGIFL